MRAKIIGTGSYVPPKIVTNNDIAKIVDKVSELEDSGEAEQQ